MNQKEIFSEYQLKEIEKWSNYVEKCRPILRSKFKTIIDRYDLDNISKLKGDEVNVKELTIYHGSGDLNFSIEAVDDFEGYENQQYIFKNEYLFPEYDFSDIEFDFIYPNELDPYLEEYREGKLYDLKKRLLFQMMLEEWRDLNGHNIGIKVGTWENNAAATFDFIKYNWEDYLPRIEIEDREIEYPYILPRELTSFEIQKRLEYDEYNPYKCLWRYFIKNDRFAEYGIFDNYMGYREGLLSEFSSKKFEIQETPLDYRRNRFDNKKEILLKCDELIRNGFKEIPRPSNGPKLLSNLVEWDFYSINNKDYLSDKQLVKIKSILPDGIPESYYFFIRRMHNIEPKWEFNSFKIRHREWRRIKNIISPVEINKYYLTHKNLKADKLIPIFEDTFGHLACLKYPEDQVVYLTMNNLKNIDINFESFISGVTGISDNFNIMQYHLQNNNYTMIQSWIKNGWDVNEKIGKGGSDPIRMVKRHEIIKLLLENGADVNKVVLRDDVELKTLLMLVEYKVDFKQILINRDYLKNKILGNQEYKKIHKYIE